MEINVDGFIIDLKVGADPEVFVKNSDKLVSAYGLVPGTKESPHKVPKGAIQVDGMALEFNIDPADSIEEFVDNVNSVMKTLSNSIPHNYKLAILPTAEFGLDYIESQPSIAKELGCTSDYNAYTSKSNPKPNAQVPFRTAAGHVHIGWTDGADCYGFDFMKLCCDFTKVLDLYLGIPSILLDSDVKRRELYGKAGAFRPKPYGLEYRVLSNFWLSSEKYMQWVYSQTQKAITVFLGGFRIEDETITEAINSSDVGKARKIMTQYGLEEPLHA